MALDETKKEASGCSIDTLQHQIQKIENNLSISLLNRLNIFCILNDEIVCIPSIDLKNHVDRNTDKVHQAKRSKKRSWNSHSNPKRRFCI